MKNKLKIGDFLIVGLIILSSIGIFFISKNNINTIADGNLIAIIKVNGKEIDRVDINEDSNGKTIPIETEYGYNLLEFSDKGVRSIEASCPDKLDVLQGYITQPGEMIVCLPNRLVVELYSESPVDVNEVDVVN